MRVLSNRFLFCTSPDRRKQKIVLSVKARLPSPVGKVCWGLACSFIALTRKWHVLHCYLHADLTAPRRLPMVSYSTSDGERRARSRASSGAQLGASALVSSSPTQPDGDAQVALTGQPQVLENCFACRLV